MKRIILIVCVMLLFCVSVFADFSVTADVVNRTILIEGEAFYEFSVSNTGEDVRHIQVFSIDPQWIIYVNPSLLTLHPGTTRTVTVSIAQAHPVAVSNAYSVPLTFRDVQTNERVTYDASILVTQGTPGQYVPNLGVRLSSPSPVEYDQLSTYPIDFTIVNYNRLVLHDLQVHYESSLFTEYFVTDVDSSSQVQHQAVVSIPTSTPPGTYQIYTYLMWQGGTINSEDTRDIVIPVFEKPFVQSVEQTSRFLKREVVVDIMSASNVEHEDVVRFAGSRFDAWFTNRDVQYEDGVVYERLVLQPGEQMTLVYVISYRGFVITLIAFIVLVTVSLWAYYTYRSPVIVTRQVNHARKDHDGIKKVKILLHVKNRTNRVLEHIQVYQQLSSLTQVEDGFEMGTIKPSKIMKHSHKGSLARWDFATLDPYEERIITFKVQSALTIVGDMTLPPTTVKYHVHNKLHQSSFKGFV
ncbi:MAG: hypothetical protein ACMXYC_00665 [Candidatus Woesearchaeota archaeon]